MPSMSRSPKRRRRKIRASAIKIAVGTLAALVALGACTSDGGEPRSERPTPAETVAPGSGSRVDFGVIGEPATLDPYAPTASDLTLALVRPLYRSLFRFSPEGTPEPDLATGMERVPGGVRVELDGASWSDGSRITASDVVRSVRRARPPSGFAGLRARAVDRDAVELLGGERAWPQRLARATFVLPGGKAKQGIYSGPLRLVGRTVGLRVVYSPNPVWDGEVALRKLRVLFVEDTGTMRSLLEDGRLDAAAIPSSVNLAARLRAGSIAFDRTLGRESVWLDLSSLGRDTRRALASSLDRDELEEGFVRSDGRVSDTLDPRPGAEGASGPFEAPPLTSGTVETFSLAVPQGDELLRLVQRAIQLQLSERDIRIDLVTIDARRFYGPWRSDAPVDAFLLRTLSGAGDARRVVRSYRAVPLFQVATYLAGNGVEGLEVNPTLDGPLWNAHNWRRKAS